MPFRQMHVPLRRVQVRMSHQLSHTEHVDARFNGPCSIAFNRAKVAAPLSIRRRYLVSVALLAASVSTVLNMAWNASWLKHAGSPHGMGAGPGLWQSLGPSLIWSFVAATVLSFFGRRKGSSLDDRLVRINVGGISANFHTSIRLAFRFLSSPLSGFLTFLRDLFSRSIHRFLRSLL